MTFCIYQIYIMRRLKLLLNKDNANETNIRLIKGKIKEQTLVKKFFTDKELREYLNTGKFKNSTSKKKLHTELNRYCEYEYDSENKFYYITHVLSTPIPKSFSKFNNGISKYLIPLILRTLLTERDKNDKIEIPIDKYLTLTNWAKKINMVNGNYNLVKHNSKATSDIYNLDIDNTIKFMRRLTEHINYYIQQALDRLSKCAVIKYYKRPIVCVEIYEDAIVEGRTVRVSKYEEKRCATDEEIKFINKCETIADRAAKIEPIITGKNDREYSGKFQRYFGNKSYIYKESLRNELAKRNIKYTYDAYAVFMVDEKRCLDVLQMFGNIDFGDLEIEFNCFLKDMLHDGCVSKLDKEYKAFVMEHQNDVRLLVEEKMKNQKVIGDYATLSNITISRDAGYIISDINTYRTNNKTKEDTQDDYRVEVINKGVKNY